METCTSLRSTDFRCLSTKSYDVTMQMMNLFGSTFAWYHFFYNILQNEIWDFSLILIFGFERFNAELVIVFNYMYTLYLL